MIIKGCQMKESKITIGYMISGFNLMTFITIGFMVMLLMLAEQSKIATIAFIALVVFHFLISILCIIVVIGYQSFLRKSIVFSKKQYDNYSLHSLEVIIFTICFWALLAVVLTIMDWTGTAIMCYIMAMMNVYTRNEARKLLEEKNC